MLIARTICAISISCFSIFSVFFSTNEDFEHLSMKKDTLIKLSGSGNQKLFLPICWRNI